MPKCIDCGLLAIQDPHNQAVVEMVMRTRHDGHFTHCKGSRISAALTFCYAMSDAFPETSSKIPDNIDEWSRERECDCFMTYHIGRSPKEHDDMLNRESLKQLQSQMNRLEYDKFAAMERHYESVEKNAARHRTVSWIAILISIILALIAIVSKS